MGRADKLLLEFQPGKNGLSVAPITPVHNPPLATHPQVCLPFASIPEFLALICPLLTPLLQCRLRVPAQLCSVLPTSYRTEDWVQIPALPFSVLGGLLQLLVPRLPH